MNKVKLGLASVAILLGTGFGFANAGTYQEPTVYFNCTENEWREIPDGFSVSCDASPVIKCRGLGTPGNPVPLAQTGCGTLVQDAH